MDSLDVDNSIHDIVVCTHHSPYSNSKVVGSSVPVQESFVPRYERSGKAKLFITGHSHNLEYFKGKNGKQFLVIGGGGGISQPLYEGSKEKYHDLIDQAVKPRFFYIKLQRKGSDIEVRISGYSTEMSRVKAISLTF
jgi:hypothetical protein